MLEFDHGKGRLLVFSEHYFVYKALAKYSYKRLLDLIIISKLDKKLPCAPILSPFLNLPLSFSLHFYISDSNNSETFSRITFFVKFARQAKIFFLHVFLLNYCIFTLSKWHFNSFPSFCSKNWLK